VLELPEFLDQIGVSFEESLELNIGPV